MTLENSYMSNINVKEEHTRVDVDDEDAEGELVELKPPRVARPSVLGFVNSTKVLGKVVDDDVQVFG